MGRLRRIAAVLAGTGAPDGRRMRRRAGARRSRVAAGRRRRHARAGRRGATTATLDRVAARARDGARGRRARRAALAAARRRPHRAAPRCAARCLPARSTAAPLARYRAAYDGARKAARRLAGARGVEERRGARVGRARSPRSDRLDAEPLPGGLPQPAPQHAHLDAGARSPRAGERRSFGADPAVFQYVPGRGHAAAPARELGPGQRAAARLPAPARRLRRARRCGARLDALARLARAARRLRGVGVLLRLRAGHAAVDERDGAGDRRPGAVARRARVPCAAVRARSRGGRSARSRRRRRPGVAVPAAGGRRYVMYSFAPTLQILNGELQAINGLRDAAVLGRSAARRAARPRGRPRGARGARRLRHGRLVALLRGRRRVDARLPPAHDRLPRRALPPHRAGARTAARERRFARYEHEPPRIGIAPLRGLWARRSAPLRFTLSKGSAVSVRVFGPRGLVLARDMQLGRGGHDLSWTPPSRGRFRVQVRARGPEGRLGRSDRTVRVALPKPKPKKKDRSRSGRCASGAAWRSARAVGSGSDPSDASGGATEGQLQH